MLTGLALILGGLALGSCVDQRVIPQTRPAPAPAPTSPSAWRPAPVPSAPPPTSWADNPATRGDWRWSEEGGQSVARFAGGRLVLRCAGSLRIERAEAGLNTTSAATMRIVTQTQARTFSAVPQRGYYAIDLPPRDPLLDAMAFSKGRFAVEVSGLPTLYVPSWAEVSRVIEDCRG